DIGVFQAERKARDAVAEVEHLVEHDIAQAFDARDPVADFANHAHVPPGDGGLGASDACFDILYQRAHRFSSNPGTGLLPLEAITRSTTCRTRLSSNEPFTRQRRHSRFASCLTWRAVLVSIAWRFPRPAAVDRPRTESCR